MTHNKLLHLGLMLISVLAIGPGCVNVENEPAHRTWPKAIKVQTVNQFQGIYRDASLDPATGQVGKYGTGLFAALSGQRHSQGDQCELRFSPDGNVLHLKLKDSKGKQIEAADLKRGVDYSFSRGQLAKRMGVAGMTAEIDPIATAVGHVSKRFQVSSNGGLLGEDSGTGIGMVIFVIPMIGTGEKCSYWPKVGE